MQLRCVYCLVNLLNKRLPAVQQNSHVCLCMCVRMYVCVAVRLAAVHVHVCVRVCEKQKKKRYAANEQRPQQKKSISSSI